MVTPVIMEAIEQRGLLKNMKWAPAPLQIALCGVFLTFATPMCCALYPQISPISINELESELQVYLRNIKYCIFVSKIIHLFSNHKTQFVFNS